MTSVDDPSPPPIEVAATPGGDLLYRIFGAPEDLPAVQGRDLRACWVSARSLAKSGAWGSSRRFRFVMRDGVVDIAMADPDACCWAAAVDARAALTTRYGLSLLLRLLALIDLIGRSEPIRRLIEIRRGEAELHPSLLAAAASARLNHDARFDGFESLAALGVACELQVMTPGSRQ